MCQEEPILMQNAIFNLLQNINKRLSLPADFIAESYIAKHNVSPSADRQSRASRRQSLSEIGFGRMETYTKLDKLGQVRSMLATF